MHVSRDSVELADTSSAVLLKEGSLPTRYYIPRADVRMELLEPAETITNCPFKGNASYWSLAAVPDIAWCYEEPIEGAAQIAGLVCFFNEKVDIVVDGEAVPAQKTPWS